MKSSTLEMFTCLNGYMASLPGDPGMIVGPWGVNLSTDPRLLVVGDDYRREQTQAACARTYLGDAAKISKCTEESYDLETKLLKGEITVADVVKKSKVTAGGEGFTKVPVAPGVVQGPRGLQQQVKCFPSFMFKPDAALQGCEFDERTLPWIIAAGFSLVALGFFFRK